MPTDTDVSEANGEAELKDIVVDGLTFQAELPYKEGHPLTAGEAVALNQTYSENLRNNFANRVKKAKASAKATRIQAWHDAGKEGPEPNDDTIPADEMAKLQAAWDEYVTLYEFNGRRVSRPQGDPIDREARKMARAVITTHCKEQTPPVNTKDFTDERWDDLINQVLEKYPDIKEQARVRVEANKAVLSRQIDL